MHYVTPSLLSSFHPLYWIWNPNLCSIDDKTFLFLSMQHISLQPLTKSNVFLYHYFTSSPLPSIINKHLYISSHSTQHLSYNFELLIEIRIMCKHCTFTQSNLSLPSQIQNSYHIIFPTSWLSIRSPRFPRECLTYRCQSTCLSNQSSNLSLVFSNH